MAGCHGDFPPFDAHVPARQGRPPAVRGSSDLFNKDPHWRDLILFYEYFHGDNRRGPRRQPPDGLDRAWWPNCWNKAENKLCRCWRKCSSAGKFAANWKSRRPASGWSPTGWAATLSGTVAGTATRRYHGLLGGRAAAAGAARTLLVAGLDESVRYRDTEFSSRHQSLEERIQFSQWLSPD